MQGSIDTNSIQHHIKVIEEDQLFSDIMIFTQVKFQYYFGNGTETGTGETEAGWDYSESGGDVIVTIPAKTNIYLKSNPVDGVITHFKYDATNFPYKAYTLKTEVKSLGEVHIIGSGMDQTILVLDGDADKFATDYLWTKDNCQNGVTTNIIEITDDDVADLKIGQTIYYDGDSQFYKITAINTGSSPYTIVVDRDIVSAYNSKNVYVLTEGICFENFTIDGRGGIGGLGGSRIGDVIDLSYATNCDYAKLKIINCNGTDIKEEKGLDNLLQPVDESTNILRYQKVDSGLTYPKAVYFDIVDKEYKKASITNLPIGILISAGTVLQSGKMPITGFSPGWLFMNNSGDIIQEKSQVKLGFVTTDEAVIDIDIDTEVIEVITDSYGFAIGGDDSNGNCLQDCDRYNDTGNSWASRTDMPSPIRKDLAGFSLGTDYGFAEGGKWSTSKLFKDCDRYSDIGNSWAARTDMPAPDRQGLAGFSLGTDYGFAEGGFDSAFNYLQDCDRYSDTGNLWSSRTDIPVPARDILAGFSLGADYGFAEGGNDNTDTPLQDCDRYSDTGNSWSNRTDMSVPGRRDLAGFSLGTDYGFAEGGNDSTPFNYLQDCDRYSDTGNLWSSRTDMPAPGRNDLAGFSMGADYGFAEGGSIRYSYFRDCDRYSDSGNSWSSRTDAPAPNRNGLAGFDL